MARVAVITAPNIGYRNTGMLTVDLAFESLRRRMDTAVDPTVEVGSEDKCTPSGDTVTCEGGQTLAPGQTITLDIAFTAKIPRPFARTGAIGNYFFIAQWFPKIGVLSDTGWQARQFHMTTEFFADFGAYDVRLTVPSAIATSGRGPRSVASAP